MDGLNPQRLSVETVPGRIDKAEVRVNGLCQNGLKQISSQ
jgi:hypothetical protein